HGWLGTGAGGGGTARLVLPAGPCSPALPAGLFRGPDRCCREHDRCSAQIAALQFNYGIRNYRLHTVSHCDCDARWRYGVVPLARMVQQSQYHYSLPAEETHSPAVQPSGKGRKPSRAGRKRLRQGLGRNPRLRQAQRPPTAQWSRGPGTLSPASARWHPVLGLPLTTLLSSGLGRVCRCYKHLDKCEHQIAPREVKYQLHNVDTRMLFHCNCTRRCVTRRKRQGFSHHHRALYADDLGSGEMGPRGMPTLASSC
uniref:Phospholipase A2-like central domain-containing protein n=1 Tax=Accipiter nisus TaxID=211598 RepID=A0A8B9MVK5_9AVES